MPCDPATSIAVEFEAVAARAYGARHMCTLVVAARAVPGFPLVIVANRDEQRDRASSPPRRWAGGTSFVAPRDEVAGGTWLGLNEAGLFVAITNRFLGPQDRSRTSRGMLVVEALRNRTAREVHAAMSALDPARYNGFHLVYADERDVLATASDGRDLAQLSLGDGVSIVTERSFGAGERGDDDKRRVAKIDAAWSKLMQSGEPFDPVRATTLLTEHDPDDPLAATCIHLDHLRYGTRSSLVLSIAERSSSRTAPFARTRMLWAEGPPCTTAFSEIDVASMMSASPPKSG